MNQATLIWFALTALLIFAMRGNWIWVVGLCIALLPAKPQNGILFSLAGLVWAWRYDRRAIVWATGFAALLWGGSFALQPHWVQDWLASVARYNEIVQPPSLLPLGLLLPLACARLPWYAILAALQVVLFPLSDLYSLLPLLLVWIAINGRLSIGGSAISWLWQIIPFSNPLTNVWVYVIIPLVVCALWRSYGQLLRQRLGGTPNPELGKTSP